MPSSIRWLGGCVPVSQVTSWLFGGTWLATETITAQIGNNTVTVLTGSTAIATILANLVAAYNALDPTAYPSFAEMTASNDSTHFLLTADMAGKPFTVALSTNSASGTIAAASTTTASAGPNDWSSLANWSGNALPANSDTVTLDQPGAIKYGLNQSGVTLASLTITPGFSASGQSQLGQPQTDQDAVSYPQYRDTYLRIGATVMNINTDASLLRINTGSVQTAATVLNTGTSSEDQLAALVFKGTHASNTLTAEAGSVDVAILGGDVSTVATLTVTGATVRCGSGTTLTTVNVNSGSLTMASAATTVIVNGGTLTVNGAGAVTTMKVWAGAVAYNGTGTITTLTIGSVGSVAFSTDASRTVTNCTGYGGGALTFEAHSTTITNPVQLVGTDLSQFRYSAGTNVSLVAAGL